MRQLTTLTVMAFVLALGTLSAHADELDHEGTITNVEQRALAAELPATVVVRVKADDQSLAVMHSYSVLPAQAAALPDAGFTKMDAAGSMAGTPKSELDRDSSTDSWYFHFNRCNWYAPTYYYYGYNYYYQPYYNYYYGGYNYYYYWYRW